MDSIIIFTSQICFYKRREGASDKAGDYQEGKNIIIVFSVLYFSQSAVSRISLIQFWEIEYWCYWYWYRTGHAGHDHCQNICQAAVRYIVMIAGQG